MIVIDTKGQLCPTPLIMAKKGIQEAPAGSSIEIHTDNDTSLQNLRNYLTELKLTIAIRNEGGIHVIRLVKPETIADYLNPEAFCEVPVAKNYVVAIKSETMGNGEHELGLILMRAFVNTLKSADKLPTTILLYNSGVKIAIKDTDTAQSLQELEDKGVAIFACGTCVDYYDLKDKLGVGMISNMYTMTKYLSEAGHIIYP